MKNGGQHHEKACNSIIFFGGVLTIAFWGEKEQ
jgi:hypothetical protein